MIGTIKKKAGSVRLESDLSRYVAHVVISVIIGLAAGSGAVLFHHILENMRFYLEPGSIGRSFSFDEIAIICVPLIGSAACVLMTKLFPDVAKEKGIISVIKSMILDNGLIRLSVTIFHMLASIAAIGTGAPLGPEAPAAKIGSGIGSSMSQALRLSRDDMVMYAAAGGGAAISAVFNAPITGVFFGIEVILLNDLKNRALSALIISSVAADILSRAILGNKHVLSIPQYSMGGIEAYPFFILFGILAGLVCIAYFMLDSVFRSVIEKRMKASARIFTLLCVSALFGIVLLKYQQLYGIGYLAINNVLARSIEARDVAALLAMKLIFVPLFLRAGSYGGTFAPSLGIGAFSGFVFASAASEITGVRLDPAVFALVGMGGVLAGIASAPLTAIMIVFEVTSDYAFILPLMLASVISYLVSLAYNRGTVYGRELLECGIDVSKRSEADILGKIRVGKLMRADFEQVNHRLPFRELLDIVMNSRYGDVVVVDDSGRLEGIISLRDIRQAIADHDLADLLIARDVMRRVTPVGEKDPVSTAIQNIEEGDLEVIPVAGADGKLAGVLAHADITAAYGTLLRGWKTNQFLIDYSRRFNRKRDSDHEHDSRR